MEFNPLIFFCCYCFPVSFCFKESFGISVNSFQNLRFIIYKLPRYTKDSVGSGVDYMYLDPSLPNWHMSKHAVNTTEGALGRTLNQLYQRYEVCLHLYDNYILYISMLFLICLFSCLFYIFMTSII